ncbi:MAG: hypothetical protein HUU55_00195 [Myxococcales bacterium]|nr:hypothetical protein [Myxococcales bacterium]
MANANLPTGDHEHRADLNEQPPILGSWKKIYGVVIGVLVVEIILFVVLGKVFV